MKRVVVIAGITVGVAAALNVPDKDVRRRAAEYIRQSSGTVKK